MKMELFNVWKDGQCGKTTVIANDMNDALDKFCQRWQYVDHADYCQEHELSESDLNIESVSNR